MGKGIRCKAKIAKDAFSRTFNVNETRSMRRKSMMSFGRTVSDMEQKRLKARRNNRAKNKVARASRKANRVRRVK